MNPWKLETIEKMLALRSPTGTEEYRRRRIIHRAALISEVIVLESCRDKRGPETQTIELENILRFYCNYCKHYCVARTDFQRNRLQKRGTWYQILYNKIGEERRI